MYVLEGMTYFPSTWGSCSGVCQSHILFQNLPSFADDLFSGCAMYIALSELSSVNYPVVIRELEDWAMVAAASGCHSQRDFSDSV